MGIGLKLTLSELARGLGGAAATNEERALQLLREELAAARAESLARVRGEEQAQAAAVQTRQGDASARERFTGAPTGSMQGTVNRQARGEEADIRATEALAGQREASANLTQQRADLFRQTFDDQVQQIQNRTLEQIETIRQLRNENRIDEETAQAQIDLIKTRADASRAQLAITGLQLQDLEAQFDQFGSLADTALTGSQIGLNEARALALMGDALVAQAQAQTGGQLDPSEQRQRAAELSGLLDSNVRGLLDDIRSGNVDSLSALGIPREAFEDLKQSFLIPDFLEADLGEHMALRPEFSKALSRETPISELPPEIVSALGLDPESGESINLFEELLARRLAPTNPELGKATIQHALEARSFLESQTPGVQGFGSEPAIDPRIQALQELEAFIQEQGETVDPEALRSRVVELAEEIGVDPRALLETFNQFSSLQGGGQ